MSLEGDVQKVQLIEVDIDCLEARSDEQIPWRRMIEGLELPRIDGALVLYDVMNHRSIATVPEILGKLAHPPIRLRGRDTSKAAPKTDACMDMRLREAAVALLTATSPSVALCPGEATWAAWTGQYRRRSI